MTLRRDRVQQETECELLKRPETTGCPYGFDFDVTREREARPPPAITPDSVQRERNHETPEDRPIPAARGRRREHAEIDPEVERHRSGQGGKEAADGS